MSRPRKEDARRNVQAVRFTNSEIDQLRAQAGGAPLGEWIRRALFGSVIPERYPKGGVIVQAEKPKRAMLTESTTAIQEDHVFAGRSWPISADVVPQAFAGEFWQFYQDRLDRWAGSDADKMVRARQAVATYRKQKV